MMKKLGKPVDEKTQRFAEALRAAEKENTPLSLDFSNTATAFALKTDKQLKKAAWLFGLMNRHWLVGIGSRLGVAAIRMHLPFVEGIVKNTIFEQFCGGATLLESQKVIQRLYTAKVFTILDYGSEAKESEDDFNHTMNETIRALDFAQTQESVPMVSAKITGLARAALLEARQSPQGLSPEEIHEYQNVLKRMDAICHSAMQRGVAIAFDAEESWIQDAINELVVKMMERYNREKAVVYSTFQLYRSDQLDYLRQSHQQARERGYLLGAKLVRGAYMEKERERAAQMGYPSPIHPNKEATDAAYNAAVRYCVAHFEEIAFVNATHNAQSSLLQAELMANGKIPFDHPHILFCQLYGMSDNITFNLAKAGFRVAKYLPYGPVREVAPYLIRRAHENASLTGDMSREYQLVLQELKRRGLA
jgi:proline dehydrogenase